MVTELNSSEGAGEPAADEHELGLREAELIAARRNNLAELRAAGHDPFRAGFYPVTTHAAELAARFADRTAEEGHSEDTFALAGRLLSVRYQGKTIFADLHDRSGRIQLYMRRDEVGDEAFRVFKLLDRGDGIGVQGDIFRSKMGELTLKVHRFEVLAKALAPLPDKFHGLVDVEKRYRQRYVDLAVNPHVREVFMLRSKIVSNMRRFLDDLGFLEVETPTLLHVAGGAAARPFSTHANALDCRLDLRIATELNLKRCIVGGLERVYEIGRIFRNEGIDSTHNPEFTTLELYAAYWSLAEMMEFNEALFAHLALLINPERQLQFGDRSVSFAPPFKRLAYLDAFAQYGNLKADDLLDPERTAAILRDLGMPTSPTHAHALDKLFDRFVEPQLIEPTFIYDYPVVLSPLAKRKVDNPLLTERYELFALEMELANAFGELNDPDDQRARFEAQIEERASGDAEVPAPDWDFVRALEFGMPPTAGIGVGIDRLVMLLTNQLSIRDVILFPLQRSL
jgi:lysyl-tRNA synthetase class 2